MIGLALLAAAVSPVSALDAKVALAQLPTSDTFSALMKGIAEETGANFSIDMMPRARAIYLVENKQVDVMIPATDIRSQKSGELKFDYSATIYKVCYVLYTNKSKNITAAELKAGNPNKYKIEVDNAYLNGFDFSPLGSSSAEASLQKVDNGTIDGFIYSQPTGDPLLKKLGLKNVKRQAYAFYDVLIAIQKGGKGGELDKLINSGMAKMKADGKFEKLMGSFIKNGSSFIEWQP
jgi:polar amino acid transport system substrate-binding protein